MKYFATLLLLLCISALTSAQVLQTENFNYTAGDALTAHGWSAHSGAGTNPELVTTGLTYSGYLGSNIGGASTLANNGQDVNKTWASSPNGVASGNLYYSLLVNLDSAQTAGDYFFHFYKNSSTFPARLYARKAYGSQNFSFGILKGSTFANIAWSDSVYSFGTTYLVVVKYSFIAGATNDTVALWINPTLTGSEPAATVLETTADKAVADYDTVYGYAIRQGSATSAARGKVDGIRAFQSWKNLNNVFAVLDKNSINFTNITLGTAVTDSVKVTNNDATPITISAVSSGNSVFVVTPTTATVSAGTTQKFVVTYTPTGAVSTSSAIVITSDAASSPDSVYITGNAIVPGFTISTKTYSFGNIYIDSTIVDSVTVTNALAANTLNITAVTSSNPVFTVGPTSGSLAVGASMKFGISFKPTSAGLATSFIAFANNGGLVSDTLKVSGNGITKAPSFLATPTLKDFHGVLLGKSNLDSVVVMNNGYDSLIVSGVASTDAAFTVTPTSARIDSQASKKFYVTFTPSALGLKSASLVFTSNVTEVKDTVAMVGSGTSVVAISEARKDLNSDFIADHSVSLDTLAIAGVVTSPNMGASASQTSYFIQDATGGIDVFFFGLTATNYLRGDSVVVIGTVAQYRGLVEFTPLALTDTYFKVVSHVGVPTPKRISLHQFVTNGESYEGQLVEIDTLIKSSGTWPASPANASVYLTNSAKIDSMQLFLDLDAQITGTAQKPYPINIVGVVSQYTTAVPPNIGYEISPRDSLDIIHTPGTAGAENQFSGVPKNFELYNSYPNPFNPSTTIQYGLPQQSKVTLKVFSILGQEIATLVNDIQGASYHKVQWNGRDNNGTQVSSGVYFFRIVAEPLDGKSSPFTQVRKMMLMK